MEQQNNEAELRLHRCCFTGHRPEKLTKPEDEIKAGLEKEIRRAISDGYTTFISGMARGVDIWAAEIVLRLRSEGENIKLICAIPYDGFEQKWESEWLERFQAIIRSANCIEFVCEHYSRSCFQIRNVWMVDHSSRLIAVFNGEPGGTKNTIDYAKKNGVTCFVCA